MLVKMTFFRMIYQHRRMILAHLWTRMKKRILMSELYVYSLSKYTSDRPMCIYIGLGLAYIKYVHYNYAYLYI